MSFFYQSPVTSHALFLSFAYYFDNCKYCSQALFACAAQEFVVCAQLHEHKYESDGHNGKGCQYGQNAFADGAFMGFHPFEAGDSGIALGMNIAEQVFPAVAFRSMGV